MSQLILNDNTIGEFEHYYMNNMQLLANIIDPNMLFAEVFKKRQTVLLLVCVVFVSMWD